MFVGTAFSTDSQLVPLAEWDTVKLPDASRSSLTQWGAAIPVWFVVKLVPSAAVRPSEATPFSGVTQAKACFEPASSVSRIITPAFAHAFVFRTLLIRATIEPAPVSVLNAKWN